MRLAKPLRVAFIGDSWVTDLHQRQDGSRARDSHAAWAMRQSLRASLRKVEFLYAGFPGSRTKVLLDLCKLCRLRDVVELARKRYSWKSDFDQALVDENIWPYAEQSVGEELDVAVICLGSNDLYDESSGKILSWLRELHELLEHRGLEVIQCSLYLRKSERRAEPYADKTCREVNSVLLKDSRCVNLGPFLNGLASHNWRDEHHLSVEGYQLFGQELAKTVEERFVSQAPASHWYRPSLHVEEGHLLSFVGCLVSGAYVQDRRWLHGKPTYWKVSGQHQPEVWLFFWDDSNGASWRGWWLGRLKGSTVDHPGWAYNPSEAMEPPGSGWLEVRSGQPSRIYISKDSQHRAARSVFVEHEASASAAWRPWAESRKRGRLQEEEMPAQRLRS